MPQKTKMAGEDELEKLFLSAAEYVQDLRDLKNESKLRFYGLFKQVNDGPCAKKRPAMWDMRGCAKWDAWHSLGNMSRETAMQHYINELTRIDENWEYGYYNDDSEESDSDSSEPEEIGGAGLGIAVSTMYTKEQPIKDENKTVFDWCKEGNVDQLRKILENTKFDLNTKDDLGMTLLHWACDRGHHNIVEYLIKLMDNIDCQDNDGQTPLHLAVICEFDSIVKLLLQAGANRALVDNEGNMPLQHTSQPTIIEMLAMEV